MVNSIRNCFGASAQVNTKLLLPKEKAEIQEQAKKMEEQQEEFNKIVITPIDALNLETLKGLKNKIQELYTSLKQRADILDARMGLPNSGEARMGLLNSGEANKKGASSREQLLKNRAFTGITTLFSIAANGYQAFNPNEQSIANKVIIFCLSSIAIFTSYVVESVAYKSWVEEEENSNLVRMFSHGLLQTEILRNTVTEFKRLVKLRLVQEPVEKSYAPIPQKSKEESPHTVISMESPIEKRDIFETRSVTSLREFMKNYQELSNQDEKVFSTVFPNLMELALPPEDESRKRLQELKERAQMIQNPSKFDYGTLANNTQGWKGEESTGTTEVKDKEALLKDLSIEHEAKKSEAEAQIRARFGIKKPFTLKGRKWELIPPKTSSETA